MGLKIAVHTPNTHATTANGLKIGANQKMHIAAYAAQFCPVKPAYGPAANNANLAKFVAGFPHEKKKSAQRNAGAFYWN
jgi:hypothetical protein